MYYKDLSKYHYLKRHQAKGVLNIGWLDIKKPFNQATYDKEILISALLENWDKREAQTRGLHFCNLCSSESLIIFQNKYKLGSAEFRIPSKNKKLIFAAPDMILHYIEEHNYLPPTDFITAVNNLNYN